MNLLRALADWFTDQERWYPFPPPWIWMPLAVWIAAIAILGPVIWPYN